MPFQSYWSELMGTVPRLDPLLAQNFVNRAWRDIKDSRSWSWLIQEGTLIAPQLVNAGTCSVIQFNAVVTLDATAQAALNNLNTPVITQRQFRVAGGPIYNISSIPGNPPATLTLDRPYMESTQVGQPYSIYRCYYPPAKLD